MRERPDRGWLVAFDLDDTLYPEEQFVRSGLAVVERALRKIFGSGGFARAAWELYAGGERGALFDRALDRMGLPRDAQTLEFLTRLYQGHTPQIALYPDVVPTLERLHQRAAVAVLTDGPAALQQRKVNALKLERYVHRVVYTDEWGREFWKPHPRGFQELQEWMGLPPHRCLYVGDNPLKDFHAPRKLGWHCLRVRRREGQYAPNEVPEELGLIPYTRDLSNFDWFVMFQDPKLGVDHGG